MSYETIVTTAGRQALSTAIANNQPLPIDSFKVGDGGGAVITPSESATDVVNACYTGTPARLSVPDSTGNQVAIECVVPASSGGYTVREIGIYSNNTLICYGATPEIEKPLLENGAVGDLVLTVTMSISNADAVTLAVDPGVAVATRQYVDLTEARCNTVIDESRVELRKLLAYYDGLHITERLSRLRNILSAPSGMSFNGLAVGQMDGDIWICVSYANSSGTDGGVKIATLGDFGFGDEMSAHPCYGACYGDGIFLVGTLSGIYYSTDNPTSWEYFHLVENVAVKKVVYTGNFFLAITDNTLYKITKTDRGLAAEELFCYETLPIDIAINPDTGEAYMVGVSNDQYRYESFIRFDSTGEPISAMGADNSSPNSVFYSEPCQRVIVWGSGGARARHPQGWTNITPNGVTVLGGGVNVIFYSQYVASGTGGSTLAYFYKTLRRTLDETTTGPEISTTSALAQSRLFMFDGLLFALSPSKLMAE